MKFAKELLVGALLGGSALAASAVDVVLDFELFPGLNDKDSISTYPGISDLSFANAVFVHNAGPQIYFPTTLANGDGAMAIPTGQASASGGAITGILTLSAGITGIVSFDYVSYDTMLVKASSSVGLIGLSSAQSLAPSGSILNFESTDSTGGCSFQSTVAKTACNWRHVSIALGSTATTLEFGFANTSNDGFGLIDNVQYQSTTPVPEPTTYALMALGLLGIGFARRRQVT